MKSSDIKKWLLVCSGLCFWLCWSLPLPFAQQSTHLPADWRQRTEHYDSLAALFCATNLDSVIFYYERSQQLYFQANLPKEALLSWYEISNCAYVQQDLETMERYLKKIENQRVAKLDEDFLTKIDQSWGAFYFAKGDFVKAIEHSQNALDRLLTTPAFDKDNLYGIYNNLGMLSLNNGDYAKSIEYFKNASSILAQTGANPQDTRYAAVFNNLGLAYKQSKNTENAAFYYQKTLEIYKKNPEDSHVLASVGVYYNNAALALLEKNEADSAIALLEEALKMPENLRWEWQLLNSLAYAFQHQAAYPRALSYYQKTLALREEKFGKHHPNTAATLYHIGACYADQHNYDLALNYLNQATRACIEPTNHVAATQALLPPLEVILSEKNFLQILQKKAVCYLNIFAKSQQLQHLEQALLNDEAAIQLMEQTRRSYKSEGAKQFLITEFMDVFERSIRTANQLYKLKKQDFYLKKAFEIAERSKAVLLLEALKDAQAKQFAGIPDSLIAQEKQLKLDAVYYEKRLYIAQRKGDSTVIENCNRKLFEIHEAYHNLMTNLEKNFSDYYQLKYTASVATVPSVQALLPNDSTIFVEYFVGDSSIFIFGITRSNFQLREFQKTSDFDSVLLAFRTQLTDLTLLQTNPDEALATYNQLAFQLYNWLIAPIWQPHFRQITVVPDGFLGHLPFETFLTRPIRSTENFKNLPYLLSTADVAYAYSASFLQDLKKRSKPRANKPYGGFAGHYEQASQKLTNRGEALPIPTHVQPLPNAEREIEAVAAFTHGDAWLKKQASEENFRRKAQQYQVLHLAMHGFLDDQNPLFSYLLFTVDKKDSEQDDDQLAALEIYNLELKADLAVLSACNTGVGRVQRGEGIMSLSRAFAYAGCPALVMSLWSVPDQSTSDLMVRFFKNLKSKEKMTKSEALRRAKLAYLAEQDAFSAHPIFWAGFVAMGDMQPIDFQGVMAWYGWLLGGLGIVAGAWWLVRRLKLKANFK